jgi:outer membrane protein assembly factor BamB
MTAPSRPLIPTNRLRLWPGLAAAILLVIAKFVVPLIFPDSQMVAVLGGLLCGLIIGIWWLFFSRAPWSDRLGAIILMALALYLTRQIVHESIASGMMGLMLVVHGLPLLALSLVVSTVATRSGSERIRRASLVGAVVTACAAFAVIRTEGIDGDGHSDLTWRWVPSHEERLMVQAQGGPSVTQTAPEPGTESKGPKVSPGGPASVVSTTSPTGLNPAWPGFRGTLRDSVVRGVRIETDWSRFPPVERWRRPVGPAWSSFAVEGPHFYTQEQRGEEELVVCYRLDTGEPVWRHSDPVRFWESNAGAGPRATPTLANGRLYSFGGTGILNAMEARDGALAWSRNIAADTGTKVPMWGFASSPVVLEDLVIIAAGGRLAAYELGTGKPRWTGAVRGGGYSSPHRSTIHGVDQILMQSGVGVISVAPSDGTMLWEHAWQGSTIIQPSILPDGDVLISTGGPSGGFGIRRLTVTHDPNGWMVRERWTSNGLKPYFNDFAVHRGHAYGFDGSILACINLEDGKRQWKDGRYGYGQLVLLADQDLLLVLSERGELVLVGASAEGFREIGTCKVIEGKTWNHPAIAGDVVLVRNSEVMAAYQLARMRP